MGKILGFIYFVHWAEANFAGIVSFASSEIRNRNKLSIGLGFMVNIGIWYSVRVCVISMARVIVSAVFSERPGRIKFRVLLL